ncbi:pyruvate ferredoxin oxidoreductase [Candidatus Falkowbacteria bacterium]|nr:pyruvate ferredoxin oxidoreductase [Candidatus Falkowbacteria bacterium]
MKLDNSKQFLEGSHAVAEIIKLIKPAVVAAYPITPQTHIVEDLAKMKASGEGGFEYINTESEFAAASLLLGASATGVRTYTATCSQGLLLMTEVLFNIAGMRLPVVITCANRAVSAPINIWNDQQDAVTIRDAGWLMLYGETNQEIIDLHLLAYKLAETLRLPVMVNMDGFVLTHTYEPVLMPGQEQINKFLPPYKPAIGTYLDVKNPVTLGSLATPDSYMEIRKQLAQDIYLSSDLIKKYHTDFKKVFGRSIGDNGLVEEYKTKDAEVILVAMGSVCGTIKDAIDEMRERKQKVGLLKIISFRPFADEEVIKHLAKAKYIAVVDKSISLGSEGVLATEIKRAAYNQTKAKIQSFIVGLGGRDVTKEMIEQIIFDIKKDKTNKMHFISCTD